MSELGIEYDLQAEAAPCALLTAEPRHAPHLVRLGGTDWALWRWVGLRGAGFAADEVEALASAECAAAADLLIDAESEFEAAREEAAEALRQELWVSEGDTRAAVEKALRRVRKGKVAAPLSHDCAANARLDALTEAQGRVEAARLAFAREFEAATTQVSRAIREAANSPRLQEAVIWQNRHAFHTGIASLLRKSPADAARGSKHRQHEELIASYLQRYGLKNDTIGFFGPVGWAHLTADGPAMKAEPGAELLATRRVYFEVWGMDALGEALAKDERVRAWVAPRRMPFARLEGGALHMAGREAIALSAAQAAVWLACDGVRPAKELAAQVCADGAGEVRSEEEVFEVLRRMEAAGLLTWTLEARIDPYPERSLRGQLERIGDEGARREALAKLDELEAAREAVARAAGDPARLDAALGALEETFTRLTGAEATRSAGRTYAGRTLVYEDCRRDARVEVGPAMVEELGRPLSLLLESARWFTHAVAEEYRVLFDQLFDELSRKSGSPVVEFVTFWAGIRPLLLDPNDSLIHRVTKEFQRRWAEILKVPEDVERVHYTSEELRPRVLAAFAAPATGWSYARYHNPDVMVAARDAEAVRRGDYLFIMGELHIGSNTLGVPLFMEQHERQEEVLAGVEHDMPETRLFPLVPKYWPHITPRLLPVLKTSRDYYLELAPGPYESPAARTLASSDLVVSRTEAGRLAARTRDGRLSFDIVEAFATAIGGEVANHFKPLPPRERSPRVTIDRLVVARRSWRFPAEELWFAVEREPSARLLEARRWAQVHELPRRVFVKAPVEIKPFYMDFDSPVYVENLARVTRRCLEAGEGAELSFSEMLPEPEQSWLPDAEGRRYTSELRFIAVSLDGLLK